MGRIRISSLDNMKLNESGIASPRSPDGRFIIEETQIHPKVQGGKNNLFSLFFKYKYNGIKFIYQCVAISMVEGLSLRK